MEQPNLEYIEALSGGDKSFEEKLMRIIKLEFKDEMSTYHKNFKAGNYLLAAENVHKIKHKISILGLEKGYETATEFENNLKEEDISLNDAFESILSNISYYLNQI